MPIEAVTRLARGFLNVRVDHKGLSDLADALEGAIYDAEHYFQTGCADRDYEGAEDDLVAYKAKLVRWREMLDSVRDAYAKS